MKILITGCNGFLGKQLQLFYQNSKNTIIPTTRQQLDPSNFKNVKDFFSNNSVDVVIHTAVKGGKRLKEDDLSDFETNLKMFYNLEQFSEKFKIMINFGSGAEFDRTKDISLAKESEVFTRLPRDYYGLSKNLISRTINFNKTNNIFNLRLFGCFGEFEEEQRFFKNSFNRIRNKEKVLIYEDRFMDYFYADDVGNVVDFLIENQEDIIDNDFNLCYDKKYLLSEIGTIFSSIATNDLHLQNPHIFNGFADKNYTGNSEKLSKLGINLIGLEKGIEKCLIKWNKS